MAQGLRFLTTQGIPCTMHSGNILVDSEGVAILTGFGVPGGLVTSAPCQMTAQPSASAVMVYMAPEKVQKDGPYTPDGEVYSLGVLLWELSSGRMPFDEIVARAEAGPRLAKNMEQLASAIAKGLREETVTGTPEIYEQLFKMCWESEPESRPPLEVVEETLQMLVVVEPMDMLMLPGDDLGMSGMSISTIGKSLYCLRHQLFNSFLFLEANFRFVHSHQSRIASTATPSAHIRPRDPIASAPSLPVVR